MAHLQYSAQDWTLKNFCIIFPQEENMQLEFSLQNIIDVSDDF